MICVEVMDLMGRTEFMVTVPGQRLVLRGGHLWIWGKIKSQTVYLFH